MKYALISDIHGNMPAFKAVLEDANRNNVDKYIFLGDYCMNLPFPDEVLDVLMNMKDSYIIRGNQETYFENISKQDQDTWTNGQFAVLYTYYLALSAEQLAFKFSLPEEIIFNDLGTKFLLNHSAGAYFKNTVLTKITSGNCARSCEENGFTQSQYIDNMKAKLINDKSFIDLLLSLPHGIYAFGHNHMQMHIELVGKLLINPGSCGLPLDGIVDAPYSILDINDGKWEVTHKRVKYDMDIVLDKLNNSPHYKRSWVWNRVVAFELKTASEKLRFFLEFVAEYANRIGDDTRPYSIETWENAYSAFESTM